MREDWIETELVNVLDLLKNGSSKKQQKEKTGYPVSRIETISNETIDFDRVKYLINPEESEIEKHQILNGDILLSHINSDLHLGKTAIFRNNNRLLIHGINLLLLRPKHIQPRFLNYQFKFLRSKGEFIKVAQRAVNQSSINQRKLKQFKILFPPLPEQRAIVAKIERLFSELDHGVAQLNKVQAQLKVYKQAVLKKAFEGELTKPKITLFKKKLSEIIKLSKEKHKPVKTQNIFYVGLKHIKSDLGELTDDVKVDKINTVKNKFVKGQLLYGKLRPYLNKVWLSNCRGVCSTDILVFDVNENINPSLIKYFMLSKQFVSDMTANSSGVNLPRVSTKYVLKYTINVPNKIEEQTQIVQEVESRFSVVEQLEKELTANLQKSASLRQSILKQAFEGRLLSEAEIKACKKEKDWEPASELLGRIGKETNN